MLSPLSFLPLMLQCEESIILHTCIVGTLTWYIKKEVREAHKDEPDPSSEPPVILYVPMSMRSKVLEWLHTNKLFCHPGTSHLLCLAKTHFWWSTINPDVKAFVTACTTCARNKTGNQPPDGLLQPLPTPSHPWTPISVDFITGLPHLKVILLFQQSSTGFQRLQTSSFSPNSPQPSRLLSSLFNMSS